MKRQAEAIRSYLLQNIPDHPRDIVAAASKHFSVSRTAIHRHLKNLLKNKKIIMTGTTRRAKYYLAEARDKKLTLAIQPGLEEHEVWVKYFKDTFSGLPENVFSICEYGFGEMLNNAIDHSEGKSVRVEVDWHNDSIYIRIIDDGVGIFKKIAQARHLEDERESVLHLSKGKFTTDPEHHSGEGIFFTSRAMDTFAIASHELGYAKISQEKDWFVETRKEGIKGTEILMLINRDSNRLLKEIFTEYSTADIEEIPRFDKTHIVVQLSKLENERYVSRSQAKRLVIGLEKFRHVILDFKNVVTVGQGFVDEVFRVFKLKHPEVTIAYVNASEDVRFMIERGLTEPVRQPPLP